MLELFIQQQEAEIFSAIEKTPLYTVAQQLSCVKWELD